MASSGRSTATRRTAGATCPRRRTCARRSSASWSLTGSVLLEFPPGLWAARGCTCSRTTARCTPSPRAPAGCAGSASSATLAAASPAYGDGEGLRRAAAARRRHPAGRVVALRAPDGKILWTASSRAAASPPRWSTGDHALLRLRERHGLRARAQDGRIRWRYQAAARSRAALALADGKLYFGDYGGRVYAIRGRQRQGVVQGHSGARFGLGGGQLLLDARGRLRPRLHRQHRRQRLLVYAPTAASSPGASSTGGYVYASPAVAQVPGGAPTVYIGSYDGRSTRSTPARARVRWSRRRTARSPAPRPSIGDIVYFSTTTATNTFGLGARTGRHGLQHRSRRLQPGRLRRAHDLPHRLHVALRAARR